MGRQKFPVCENLLASAIEFLPAGARRFPNLAAGQIPNTPVRPYLWLCDSSHTWWVCGGFYTGISATRDGHVYAVGFDGSYVSDIDSNAKTTELGVPKTPSGDGVLAGPDSVAASIGWSGGNEVFVIGRDRAIYVNSSNTKGDWRLVDNSAQFSSLSTTANDTVFALTSGLPGEGGGQLYQETEHFQTVDWFGYFYWTDQYIGGGRIFTSISADTDASGRDEVYAIDVHADAYLYNQGIWTYKDSYVYDLAAAGGGYFYDVNYYGSGPTYAYQWNPYSGWKPLGTGLL